MNNSPTKGASDEEIGIIILFILCLSLAVIAALALTIVGCISILSSFFYVGFWPPGMGRANHLFIDLSSP